LKTTVVALSGPVGAGKSSLAKRLAVSLGALHVKTNRLIELLTPEVKKSRSGLQRAGDKLDDQTDGEWVAREIFALLERKPQGSVEYVVVDSIRIQNQLKHLRRYFPAAFVHIHLTADLTTLAKRFNARSSAILEATSYDAVRANATEKRVDQLGSIADAVIDTGRCAEQDVFARVGARLGKRPSLVPACVDVMVGGQYGSEGKGNIAHYLGPEYDVLVRVGGPNAGHSVFRSGENPFVFHHVPSGAISNPNAKLVIGAGAVIRLATLQKEIGALSLDIARLIIDEQAMIIEDSDVAWEERQLKNEIASTAQGVGHATARKILNRRPDSDVRLARHIPQLRHLVRDTVSYLSDEIMSGAKIFLEGTQGTSLGLHHGHYPHVTSRVTSVAGCLAESGLSPKHVRRVVMVCRTYPIRVGNTDTGKTSGPMSRETSLELISQRSEIPLEELRKIETTSTTKRKRRIAEFDWHQFQRSAVLNGPTDIALTFVDYLCIRNRQAYRYEQLTDDTLRFVEEVEKVGGVPVSLISTDFSERNIIDRRSW